MEDEPAFIITVISHSKIIIVWWLFWFQVFPLDPDFYIIFNLLINFVAVCVVYGYCSKFW